MLIRLLKLFWKGLDSFRRITINIIFFLIVLVILFAPTQESFINIPEKAALVLNLRGNIVEQKEFQDPLAMMSMSEQADSMQEEVLLSDIIFTIEKATTDDNISMIVLRLEKLYSGSISKVAAIGKALQKFKAAGKSVVAFGESYSQTQYQLASYANEIYLDPMGYVKLDGYSNYHLYYKNALDKLKVNRHIFRVGQFKSAVEPYIRDDMSEEAKRSSLIWLKQLWNHYLAQISGNRKIQQTSLPLTSAELVDAVKQVKGDAAALAKKLKLVDKLIDEQEFTQMINERVGENDYHSFSHIHFYDYMHHLQEKPYSQEGNIGLIIAQGVIYDGHQPPGAIGGDTMVELLQQVHFDPTIKAVVIRIDSPGGSAYASEKIRREIASLKESGKPVVISMSSVAASGGYWIAMDADYIYATPTTLTGSIGVFSVIPTFEDSLQSIGVTNDGVSTTDWASIDLTRPLSQAVKQVLQLSVNHTYNDFIERISQARSMEIKKVNEVAQGRVWDGETAHRLGLVDALGDLDAAIIKAANLAGVEAHRTQLIEQELSPEEELMQLLFEEASGFLTQSPSLSQLLQAQLAQHIDTFTPLLELNDPKHLYLLCESCP